MDRDFHIDDFERLLREKSDEFRMYPSKRIWHSIYNNIHPGRKWPSVAMSITLIFALLIMGYLNTDTTYLNKPYKIAGVTQDPIEQTNAQYIGKNLIDNSGNLNVPISTIAIKNTVKAPGTISDSYTNNNRKIAANLPTMPILPVMQQPFTTENINRDTNDGGYDKINSPATNQSIDPVTAVTNAMAGIADEKLENSEVNLKAGGYDHSEAQITQITYEQKRVITNFVDFVPGNDFSVRDIIKQQVTINIGDGNSGVEKNNTLVNKKDFISAEDRVWIENYALYNRPATKRWANKLAWQVYATPSVVYRTLYNDPNFGNTPNVTPIAPSAANQDINKAVKHTPSLGFEIGTGMQYSIFKGVKLKAGLQLNYTRYNADAFQNSHPFATRLTMHDFNTSLSYEVYKTTQFSNKNGLEAVKLHNETFQVSLPLGTDLKLVGTDNLQWNLGLTIQPTYVAGGKSYLISSDRRNYVKESSLINKWNLNAGFETFITYKSNGFTYQVGPQFRTQLFSTNSRKYAVEEKLVNYGLKFGVSKTLK
ncbi:MAG: hypothetical protein H7Z13_16055 [Ferruginibacter sp.]|nr:hypothetical protein [Ferruginibacter sp.]